MKSETETYSLPYVKLRASGNQLCEAGSSDPMLCDSLGGWDGGGGNPCTPMADLCWCMGETGACQVAQW